VNVCREWLAGRGARGDMPVGGVRREAIVLKFRPRPCGNQNSSPDANYWRFDGLMAYMTDRAGVSRKISMVMPNLSHRHPDHKREEHYRENEMPNPFFI
jgi:hypothetical protein